MSDARTRFRQVVISQTVIDRAVELTRRYRLRGYDAVHLASALILNDALLRQGLPALTMVAADDNLLAAAAGEGLPTENPNHHS